MSIVKIIGVGREGSGDDAAGLLVARKLRRRALPGVVVMEESGGGVALLDRWQRGETVILIDTTSTGSRPGTIRRCNPCDDEIPCDLVRYTHNLSTQEALVLARDIDLLPVCPILYGIEGAQNTGPELTPAVERAIDRCVEKICNEVREIIEEHEILSMREGS
jgi:hydrogenase maturation protease